jgi:two-component system nitrogen regulation response regulator GlnG
VKRLAEKYRILIIDDDEGIREVFSTILRQSGYEVDTAHNATDAIEKSRSNLYHLALIDIRLPDMEGTKLLEQLVDTTPRMKKIIVTGYPSLNNSVEALNQGADGYIMKPVDAVTLVSMVEKHLSERTREEHYAEEKVADFIKTRLKQAKREPTTMTVQITTPTPRIPHATHKTK